MKMESKEMMLKTKIILMGLLLTTASSTFADVCDFQTDIDSGTTHWDLDRVKACYRSVPLNQSDVENTVEVIQFAMDQSASRNVYKNDLGLDELVADLLETGFSNDWDFQQATMQAIRSSGNSHLWYSQPNCYRQFYVLDVFEFGSMLYRGEQVVYVAGIQDYTPIGLPFDFLNTATGIADLEQYVGLRVKTINGENALTAKSRSVALYDGLSADNGFNFSVMKSYITTNNVSAIADSSIYVLVDKQGNETALEIPAVATHASLTNENFVSLSPPVDIPGFVGLCTAPNQLTSELNGVYDDIEQAAASIQSPATVANSVELPLMVAMGKVLTHKKRNMTVGNPASIRGTTINPGRLLEDKIKKSKLKGYSGKAKKNNDNSIAFSELLEEEKGVLIEELIPYDEVPGLGASIYNNGEAIAITINSFTPQATFEGVEAYAQFFIDATDYACNSPSTKKLILDVRDGPGGSGETINWLSTFFHGVPKGSLGSYRLVNYLPVSTDMNIAKGTAWARALEVFWPNKPLDLCYGAPDTPTSGCLINPDTGALNTDTTWLTNPVTLEVGGVPELLGQPNIDVGGGLHEAFPDVSIACPDKFVDEDLVILVDGHGQSAGTLFPYLISGIGTLVGVGGLDEGTVESDGLKVGSGMGGPGSWFMEDTAYWHAYDLSDLVVSAGVDPAQMVPAVSIERPPMFQREVEVAFEYIAFRTLDGQGTISDEFPRGAPVDVRVLTWQGMNSPEANGYVYREVLHTLKTGKSVSPASH